MGQSAYRCSKGEKEKLQQEKEKGEEEKKKDRERNTEIASYVALILAKCCSLVRVVRSHLVRLTRNIN